jgi:hypothetical protein
MPWPPVQHSATHFGSPLFISGDPAQNKATRFQGFIRPTHPAFRLPRLQSPCKMSLLPRYVTWCSTEHGPHGPVELDEAWPEILSLDARRTSFLLDSLCLASLGPVFDIDNPPRRPNSGGPRIFDPKAALQHCHLAGAPSAHHGLIYLAQSPNSNIHLNKQLRRPVKFIINAACHLPSRISANIIRAHSLILVQWLSRPMSHHQKAQPTASILTSLQQIPQTLALPS